MRQIAGAEGVTGDEVIPDRQQLNIPEEPPIDIFVASFNTIEATELCVRSIHETSGHPYNLNVGDCGSKDGSIELLKVFESKGWLTLEVAQDGRQHWEWLDQWTGSSTAELAVFVDSDVEFRRYGWLKQMVGTAICEKASLVAAEFCPESPAYTEPVGGRSVRLAGRPAPWLMLVKPADIVATKCSFKWQVTERPDLPEGVLLADTGGAVYGALLKCGFTCLVMPQVFGQSYHHYGGLSWSPLENRLGVRKYVISQTIHRRLLALRRSTG